MCGIHTHPHTRATGPPNSVQNGSNLAVFCNTKVSYVAQHSRTLSIRIRLKMPKRRGKQQQADEHEAEGELPLTQEQVLERISRIVQPSGYWRPSQVLAKCLDVPYQRLLTSTRKDDLPNLVWSTVLVVAFCATQLVDLQELWFEMAETATSWLLQQANFVDHRDDLVQSASMLLGRRDQAPSLLENVFVMRKDEATLAMEAALGEWKMCYLEQPPYTLYYWNERTNHSTWRNPLETAKQEKEALERKQRREALLAKILPQRLPINRAKIRESAPRNCASCQLDGVDRQADVLCLACENQYFCDQCCDRIHCDRTRIAHVETSFRYRVAVGIQGFPKDAHEASIPTTSRVTTNSTTPC